MNKETDMTMKLNPYFESTIETSNVVWSHDENSYQFNFDFTEYLCDKPFDLTDGKPRILLEFLNDKNAEVQIYPLVVDSEKLGVAHFIIPERVLGYVGDVKASLTIDFSNKSYDLGNFMFKMKKSPIDNKMPQLQFYVDEFEKAIEKADELNAQIKDRDLVTKPELAVVENKKADKTTVNDISLHLLDKADKTDVNAVKSEMNNKADKVAVDAKISELKTDISNTQIGFLGEFNSIAELKSKYPNGTNGYAVVFENSVGYTYTYKNDVWTKGNVWNGMAIADKSITHKKTVDNFRQAWLYSTSYNAANIDTVNKKITFADNSFIYASGITAIPVTENEISYAEETNANLRLCFDLTNKKFIFKVGSIYHYDENILDLGAFRNTKSLADRITINCNYYTVNGVAQVPKYSITTEMLSGLGQLFVGVGGGDKPKFKRNGANVIVEFPKNYLVLTDGTGKLINQILTTNLSPIEIQYNKELIWNYKTNTMSVVSYRDNREKETVVLFSNSYGNCQYGFFKTYYDIQQAKEELEQSSSENNVLPAYLMSGLKEKLVDFSRVDGEFKFAFQTDIHYSPTSPYIHKFELMNQISNFGGVDLIVNGGDTSDGTYAVKQTLTEIIQSNMKINKATDYAVLQGNHDTGFAYFYDKYKLPQASKENSITPTDFYNASLKHLDNNFIFDESNKTGGYYFKDYEDSKIRCIFLNSSDCYVLENDVPQINPMQTYFDEKQLFWLANKALNFSDKTDKADWGVVIFSHASFIANSFQVVNGLIAEGLLKAFVEGTSYSGSGKMLDKEFTISKDFSEQGKMEVIAGFTGHLHCDGERQFSFNKPMIYTNCSVPKVNTTAPDWGKVPQNREIGTINAECIDFVTINRKEKKIKILRFGAGENREFNY